MPSMLGNKSSNLSTINPQSGSHSGSSSGDSAGRRYNMMQGGANHHQAKPLPPLFYFMESGDWSRAIERARRHPREVKAWASIRSKSEQQPSSPSASGATISSTKRLALHHACFKLRHSVSYADHHHQRSDPFVEVCKFILLLIDMYPEAATMRESRHGCLPLHLAAFASCTLPVAPPKEEAEAEAAPVAQPSSSFSTYSPSKFSFSSLAAALPGAGNRSPTKKNNNNNNQNRDNSNNGVSRPPAINNNLRAFSDSAETVVTTMSAGMVEEVVTGKQTDYHKSSSAKHLQEEMQQELHEPDYNGRDGSSSSVHTEIAVSASQIAQPTMSVSMGNNILISEKREEWAVKVLNALLDAFPRGIRMDSEGGRLPLHTACAGRATPRVVSTLITAYPAAARHRNKDGFLPLHLAAHWGISHPNVAIALLKAYPDATFGRNRWERTPLEEALCMAGENGRPHQAALVRSLRKHPSYWTRPVDLFETESPRRTGNNVVDIDETLPSNEDESTEDHGRLGAQGGLLHVFGGKGRNGEVEVVSPATMDLPSMIRNQNWDGVLARLEVNPSDAEQDLVVMTRGGFQSITGFTLLHYACERRPPVQVIEALIAACPRAVATRAMPGGASPLHVASTWYAPVGVMNSLIVADRNGCKTHDELGNLPLHSACFSGTSTEVIETLLRAYPKATIVRNHQGSLPEEITKRLRHDGRKAILALLAYCKEQVLAKREKKHRRNRSEGSPLANISEVPAGNPQHAGTGQELMWV